MAHCLATGNPFQSKQNVEWKYWLWVFKYNQQQLHCMYVYVCMYLHKYICNCFAFCGQRKRKKEERRSLALLNRINLISDKHSSVAAECDNSNNSNNEQLTSTS